MDESEWIVVINNDEKASFFKMATCGLVGDLHQIVPQLIKIIEERL
jgi:electron transfer flavoprotein alpha subunit